MAMVARFQNNNNIDSNESSQKSPLETKKLNESTPANLVVLTDVLDETGSEIILLNEDTPTGPNHEKKISKSSQGPQNER